MYQVIDREQYRKAGLTCHKRKQPLKPYLSALILPSGIDIKRLDILPKGSLLIRAKGNHWEVHMPISNKIIVKKMAKVLDAVAFMC